VRYFGKNLLLKLKSSNFAFLGAGILIFLFALLENVLPSTFYTAIASTSFYFIAGLGFCLLLGYSGLVSLGTGAFIAVGVFGFHYLYKFVGQTVLVSILVVLLLAIIVSIVFGFVSLRISGMYLAIITMGLSDIFIQIIKNIPSYASGSTMGFKTGNFGDPRVPLKIFGILLDKNFITTGQFPVMLSAIVFVIGTIVVSNLIRSATGRAMLSIKNSETAAQTMGVNILKYRLFAFVMAGIFGTFAGIASVIFNSGGSIHTAGLAFSLNILASAVIGGTKSIWGILVGTFVIFGLDLAIFSPLGLESVSLFINGVLIILVTMFYPGGLTQLFFDIKKLIKKLQKKRRDYLYGTEE
jgi:branched-chain amino acid transport system permease protein